MGPTAHAHSSAPEVFLPAASQRTKDIRLGHGIVLTSPKFSHPARVAERIATLDLISGGRVEFGTGESSSEAELGGFGVEYASKRDEWTDVWTEFVQKRADLGYSPEAELALQQERLGAKVASGDAAGLRGAIGTPDQVREFLRRYEAAGVDQIIFVLQAGRNSHDHIMESLELFGTQILPEFAARHDAAETAKARRFARKVLDTIAEETADGRSDSMSSLLG